MLNEDVEAGRTLKPYDRFVDDDRRNLRFLPSSLPSSLGYFLLSGFFVMFFVIGLFALESSMREPLGWVTMAITIGGSMLGAPLAFFRGLEVREEKRLKKETVGFVCQDSGRKD